MTLDHCYCLSLVRLPECEGVVVVVGGGAGAGVLVNTSMGIFTGVLRHTAVGRLNTGESCTTTKLPSGTVLL
jgi:hypothetical protein